MGGVGGPFRLDAGHNVHQMPEEAKKQVPEEILKKAREMARQEYAKKLKVTLLFITFLRFFLPVNLCFWG